MILITGGGGFIGTNLARELIDRGHEVLLIRRHPFEPPSFLAPFVGKQARISLGDISDLPFLYGTIREYGVESIVHAASLHKGTGSLHETLKSNVNGTIEVSRGSPCLRNQAGHLPQLGRGLPDRPADGAHLPRR